MVPSSTTTAFAVAAAALAEAAAAEATAAEAAAAAAAAAGPAAVGTFAPPAATEVGMGRCVSRLDMAMFVTQLQTG